MNYIEYRNQLIQEGYDRIYETKHMSLFVYASQNLDEVLLMHFQIPTDDNKEITDEHWQEISLNMDDTKKLTILLAKKLLELTS